MRKSASYRDGKRGRHKRARAPETRRWEREQLVPPCPPWLTLETLRELCALRERLQ